jgi:hypothetical protein
MGLPGRARSIRASPRLRLRSSPTAIATLRRSEHMSTSSSPSAMLARQSAIRLSNDVKRVASRGSSIGSRSGPKRCKSDSNRVSAVGGLRCRETGFSVQRQMRRNGDRNSIDQLWRPGVRTKARQIAAIWALPGNLRKPRTAWWAREDSNLQPEDGYGLEFRLPLTSYQSQRRLPETHFEFHCFKHRFNFSVRTVGCA